MQDVSKLIEIIRPQGLLIGIVILGLSWGLALLLLRTSEGLAKRLPARRLLVQQLGTLARYGVWLLGAGLALYVTVDLSPQALLALGSVIAVAGGFALKDVASAILAGVTVLVDRPFQVGDRIHFGEHYGDVVAMGLRSVKLITLDHNLVTIPNSRLLTDVVACGNAGALDMMVQLDFFIGLDQPLPRAREIVTDAMTTSRYAYLKKPWALVVSQEQASGTFALRLRAKVYVFDLAYEKALQTDITTRVWEAFQREGIAPPAMLQRNLPV